MGFLCFRNRYIEERKSEDAEKNRRSWKHKYVRLKLAADWEVWVKLVLFNFFVVSFIATGAQQYRVYTLQAFNGQSNTASGLQSGVVISPYHAQLKGKPSHTVHATRRRPLSIQFKCHNYIDFSLRWSSAEIRGCSHISANQFKCNRHRSSASYSSSRFEFDNAPRNLLDVVARNASGHTISYLVAVFPNFVWYSRPA